MTRKENIIIILILGALSTISPFSIDMYLSGLPAIAKDLNATDAQVLYSLTVYLLGISVGQLLYGPLLDRFGRRPPLYAGLTVYLIATLGCAYSRSIEWLIAMRFLQALGGCAGMVAAQTLVRDIFPVNRTAQALSSITLVIAVSPMIAPTTGSFVTVAYGWSAVFVTLAIVTTLIFIAIHFFLPDGRKGDPTLSLKPASVIGNFWSVAREPQFLTYAFGGGIAMSTPFAYIAGSPFVFMKLFGTTEQQYGWIFAIVAGGIIGMSQLNQILLRTFRNEQLVRITLVFQTAFGSLLLMGTILDWFNIYTFVAMIFVFLCGQGLTGPNSTALSLAPFQRLTGSAAALLGSYRMAVGGLVTALVSWFHAESSVPMIAVMVACPAAGLLILTIGKSAVKFRARRKEQVESKHATLL